MLPLLLLNGVAYLEAGTAAHLISVPIFAESAALKPLPAYSVAEHYIRDVSTSPPSGLISLSSFAPPPLPVQTHSPSL